MRFVFKLLFLLSYNAIGTSLCTLHLRSLIQSTHMAAMPGVSKEAILNLVRSHSEFRALKVVETGGRGLIFKHIKLDEKFKSQKGETIQLAYLLQVLRTIFPEAEFRAVSNSDREVLILRRSEDPKTIPVDVIDFEESPGLLQKNPDYFDIMPLKASNPSGTDFSRDLLRAEIGADANSKIVHFYFSDAEVNFADPEIQKIMKQRASDVEGNLAKTLELKNLKSEFNDIEKILGIILDLADLSEHQMSHLILSPKTQTNIDLILSNQEILTHFQVLKLSDLVNGLTFYRENQKRLLIYNDLRGRMPALYAASDLAIVLGPLNIFEPLNAGTPTLALDWVCEGPSYNHVLDWAEKSIAFRAVKTLNPSVDYRNDLLALAEHSRIDHSLRPYSVNLSETLNSIFRTLHQIDSKNFPIANPKF
jgi:hypothetical protein